MTWRKRAPHGRWRKKIAVHRRLPPSRNRGSAVGLSLLCPDILVLSPLWQLRLDYLPREGPRSCYGERLERADLAALESGDGARRQARGVFFLVLVGTITPPLVFVRVNGARAPAVPLHAPRVGATNRPSSSLSSAASCSPASGGGLGRVESRRGPSWFLIAETA